MHTKDDPVGEINSLVIIKEPKGNKRDAQTRKKYSIPKMTKQIAKAAFPKGNNYMRIRDEVGRVYEDDELAELYPEKGQPAINPWRLALVTVMQYVENLTDRQTNEYERTKTVRSGADDRKEAHHRSRSKRTEEIINETDETKLNHHRIIQNGRYNKQQVNGFHHQSQRPVLADTRFSATFGYQAASLNSVTIIDLFQRTHGYQLYQ